MQGFPIAHTILQCLSAAIIKCKWYLENPCSDKFNKGNSEQFEKAPRKETAPCQKCKLESRQQFERKAKMALIFETTQKSCYACIGNFYCKTYAIK